MIIDKKKRSKRSSSDAVAQLKESRNKPIQKEPVDEVEGDSHRLLALNIPPLDDGLRHESLYSPIPHRVLPGQSRRVSSPVRSLQESDIFRDMYLELLNEFDNRTPKALSKEEIFKVLNEEESYRSFSMEIINHIKLRPYPNLTSFREYFWLPLEDSSKDALENAKDEHILPLTRHYLVNKRVEIVKYSLKPVDFLAFYPGSVFRGIQGSPEKHHNVSICILDTSSFNSDNRFSGYLTIINLTKKFPALTTFFEAEIVNPVGGKTCRNPNGARSGDWKTHKWGANDEIDLGYWSTFDGFRSVCHFPLNSDVDLQEKMTDYFLKYFDQQYGGDLDQVPVPPLENSRYIFMRWKELFLYPDHQVKNVEGASFDGFYYMVYDREKQIIQGIYFHLVQDCNAEGIVTSHKALGDHIELYWDPRNEEKVKGTFSFA